MKTKQNKMTIYLDPRGPAEEEEEQIENQMEETQHQQLAENVMGIVNGVIAYTVILPLLFMFSFNISLTKMFNFANIGYVESLGVVIVARVLRGGKK
jgi:hypothetical protein